MLPSKLAGFPAVLFRADLLEHCMGEHAFESLFFALLLPRPAQHSAGFMLHFWDVSLITNMLLCLFVLQKGTIGSPVTYVKSGYESTRLSCVQCRTKYVGKPIQASLLQVGTGKDGRNRRLQVGNSQSGT